MKQTDIAWCRQTFARIAPGGVWGIPRSGLIFQKTGEQQLTLIDQMPWTDGMPISPAQLLTQQEREFNLNKEHFAAAGIEVIKKDKP